MFISVYCYWGNFGAEPIPNDGLITLSPTDNAPFDCVRPCPARGARRRARRARGRANKDHRAGPQAGTSICLRRILRRSQIPGASLPVVKGRSRCLYFRAPLSGTRPSTFGVLYVDFLSRHYGNAGG